MAGPLGNGVEGGPGGEEGGRGAEGGPGGVREGEGGGGGGGIRVRGLSCLLFNPQLLSSLKVLILHF